MISTKLKKTIVFIVLLGATAYATAGTDKERVWVEFEPTGATKVMQALSKAGAEVHYRFDDLNAFAASIPANAMQGLSRNPNITNIEPDAKRYAYAQEVPYGIDAVQARAVWDANYDGKVDDVAPTGRDRLVCVIDSGLEISHEDFAGVNIEGGYPSNWNQDDCGHGTHVAGTIAAASNHIGVVGVAPGASLYIVKVFDGAACNWTYSSDLVHAAQQCQAAGANIINMSLGGIFRIRAEDRAFKALNDAGILSIAAAGNDGNTAKSYPASYSSVMSVAAIDSNNVIADFSQQNNAVEIAAPGVAVMSSVPWLATNLISVDGSDFNGGHIENAAYGTVDGLLVDGGLCDSVEDWEYQVVLCQRGDISFLDKVNNAQNGGAVAVAIYNNVSGSFMGTLGEGESSDIPAISLSMADGESLLSLSHLSSNATLTSSFDAYKSGYETWNGTSMATPHVSGVAALVWSAAPDLSNTDIRDALTQTAWDLGDIGKDNAYGYGLVQAYDAWDSIGRGGGSTNEAPVADFVYDCTGLECSFDGSGSSDDGLITSYQWDFGDGNNSSKNNPDHIFTEAGSYTVTLTVTDDQGARGSAIETVSVASSGSGGDDTTGPIISNVQARKTKGTSFEITWATDEVSDSVVTFTCCGAYSNDALVTSHSMSFRGSKGVLYTYTVSSTDAAGNTTISPTYTYQN